jgi:hypothetical protein
MQSEDLSIKFTEEQAALRSRLSSLKWFARLDGYQQLAVLRAWEKADSSGVLTKAAFCTDLERSELAYGLLLSHVNLVRKYLGHSASSVLTEFGDKFFFNDYIVVTYGTLTLSDPKHYEVYCQLLDHDLDVATLLRYVPLKR